jgi:hypothetical protein
LSIVAERSVSAGPRAIPAAHGSFDNDVAIITATLRRILDLPADASLSMPVVDLDY